MTLKNRTALIIGGGAGLGRAIALAYAKEGAKLAVADLKAETAQETLALAGVKDGLTLAMNIGQPAEIKAGIKAVTDRFGTLDIMVNCAGGASSRVLGYAGVPYHELPVEVIDWGLDVNLKGAVYFCHAVLGQMIKQKSGVFINLGSVEGVTGSACLDYGAAKSAMIGLTKSLTVVGLPHGIRACCVSPGPSSSP